MEAVRQALRLAPPAGELVIVVREEHSKTVTSVWRRGYTDNPGLRHEFLVQVCNRNPWV